MRRLVLGVLIAAAASAASAQTAAQLMAAAAGQTNVSASITLVCSPNYVPSLNVSYAPGTDAGQPGLFFFGLLAADQSQGMLMTPQGWTAYSSGLFPFQARYDNGFPGSVSVTVPLPLAAGVMNTRSLVGYTVYAGHGAYTAKAQQMVANRRAMLSAVKAQRVAAGTWRSDYDTDDQYIYANIQKDMVDNKKFGLFLTVPFFDCTPQWMQGGQG